MMAAENLEVRGAKVRLDGGKWSHRARWRWGLNPPLPISFLLPYWQSSRRLSGGHRRVHRIRSAELWVPKDEFDRGRVTVSLWCSAGGTVFYGNGPRGKAGGRFFAKREHTAGDLCARCEELATAAGYGSSSELSSREKAEKRKARAKARG